MGKAKHSRADTTECDGGQTFALEDYGIVHREVFAEMPPRVEYSLTDLGKTLRPVIDAMWTWGEEHKERLRLQDK